MCCGISLLHSQFYNFEMTNMENEYYQKQKTVSNNVVHDKIEIYTCPNCNKNYIVFVDNDNDGENELVHYSEWDRYINSYGNCSANNHYEYGDINSDSESQDEVENIDNDNDEKQQKEPSESAELIEESAEKDTKKVEESAEQA